jgi:hypothetical protein
MEDRMNTESIETVAALLYALELDEVLNGRFDGAREEIDRLIAQIKA